MSRPPSGSMVWWRFRAHAPCAWRFGYCTYLSGQSMIRLGAYNGDTTYGSVVDADEIEWKEYRRG